MRRRAHDGDSSLHVDKEEDSSIRQCRLIMDHGSMMDHHHPGHPTISGTRATRAGPAAVPQQRIAGVRAATRRVARDRASMGTRAWLHGLPVCCCTQLEHWHHEVSANSLGSTSKCIACNGKGQHSASIDD